MIARLRPLLARIAESARLACGLPSYEAYVAHQRTHHPGQVPLTRVEFFRDRQAARYRRGSSRCC